MTPAQLLLLAQEVAARYPEAELVKNGVGNLALMRDGYYIGFADLEFGDLCVDEKFEDPR